jgi:hypothetical protein
MSQGILRALACAVCIVAIPATALPESLERINREGSDVRPSKNLMSILTGDQDDGGSPAYNTLPALQTPSVVGNTSINITQPQIPDSAQPQAAKPDPEPIAPPAAAGNPPPVVAAQPEPREQAPSRRASSGVSEADWWKDTGNPAVFTFSKCLSRYSRAQALEHPKLNLKSVLAKAIKADCEQQFDAVSLALAERFGSKRGRKMAEELSSSTFVPAVREAVLNVRQEQKAALAGNPTQTVAAAPAAPAPAAQPQPASTQPAGTALATVPAPSSPQAVGPHLELAIAKEEMFTCYRTRTDRAGPQPPMPVDAVVDQVLLECSDHTRAFFKRLFEVYPHPEGQQADKMREAIATNYRPAIASRVEQLRAGNVTAPASGTASSTVVKSATSASQ